jgi:hypothetical protein
LETRESARGFLGNVIGQGVGLITDHVKEKLTRAVLGNLYTYSLTKIGSQLGELAKGNLIKSGQSVKQYIDNAQQRAAAKKFASDWKGKGYEKGQSQPFWLSLLKNVYGVEHPEQLNI